MSQLIDRSQKLDTERALLVFFLILGTSMFALTYTFEYSTSALFPRLTAGIIIIGSTLLLVQNQLPARLQRIVAEPVSLAEPDSEFETMSTDEEEAAADGIPSTRGVPDAVATFGLLLGYIFASYLIGILWATPVFTLAYSWWFNQSGRTTTIIFVTAMVIVLAFFFLVDAPLEDGLLLEWIW
jgi:hypothetical protein